MSTESKVYIDSTCEDCGTTQRVFQCALPTGMQHLCDDCAAPKVNAAYFPEEA